MTKVEVAKLAQVPPEKMIGVDAQGKKLILANVGGKLYAIDGICTHQGGHLWEGKLIGMTVKCPRHGSEYDLATGKVLKGPWVPFGKAYNLKAYPVTTEGDGVFVEI
ncbi:MAG TPA: Rieske 2Fe-2S domain-containing protein [Methanomassiliicoccales archaeon]|nr:Rieske 2Fe-2S domain-containing protein [Methanomassiliicoccales archaeon]